MLTSQPMTQPTRISNDTRRLIGERLNMAERDDANALLRELVGGSP